MIEIIKAFRRQKRLIIVHCCEIDPVQEGIRGTMPIVSDHATICWRGIVSNSCDKETNKLDGSLGGLDWLWKPAHGRITATFKTCTPRYVAPMKQTLQRAHSETILNEICMNLMTQMVEMIVWWSTSAFISLPINSRPPFLSSCSAINLFRISVSFPNHRHNHVLDLSMTSNRLR